MAERADHDLVAEPTAHDHLAVYLCVHVLARRPDVQALSAAPVFQPTAVVPRQDNRIDVRGVEHERPCGGVIVLLQRGRVERSPTGDLATSLGTLCQCFEEDQAGATPRHLLLAYDHRAKGSLRYDLPMVCDAWRAAAPGTPASYPRRKDLSVDEVIVDHAARGFGTDRVGGLERLRRFFAALRLNGFDFRPAGRCGSVALRLMRESVVQWRADKRAAFVVLLRAVRDARQAGAELARDELLRRLRDSGIELRCR